MTRLSTEREFYPLPIIPASIFSFCCRNSSKFISFSTARRSAAFCRGAVGTGIGVGVGAEVEDEDEDEVVFVVEVVVVVGIACIAENAPACTCILPG